MGIDWEFEDGQVARYTVGVAVSLEPYNARQLAFRRNLIGWFAGITLTMLIVISGLLRFVLRPLQRLERQVREVEAGERTSLTGNYPSELVGLAANLNALIETERRRLRAIGIRSTICAQLEDAAGGDAYAFIRVEVRRARRAHRRFAARARAHGPARVLPAAARARERRDGARHGARCRSLRSSRT